MMDRSKQVGLLNLDFYQKQYFNKIPFKVAKAVIVLIGISVITLGAVMIVL